MKGDVFNSPTLKLKFGSGVGRVHEVYPDSVKVIYVPNSPKEFVDVLERLQVGETVDGYWDSDPALKIMDVSSAPCRWADGEIYLHLKF